MHLPQAYVHLAISDSYFIPPIWLVIIHIIH